MSQAELADKLGQYQSFVARLESGQRTEESGRN